MDFSWPIGSAAITGIDHPQVVQAQVFQDHMHRLGRRRRINVFYLETIATASAHDQGIQLRPAQITTETGNFQ